MEGVRDMQDRTVAGRRVVGLVLTWTFLVSILRALRLPNDFAEVHWLLDYRFGFTKRGLAGAVHLLGCRVLGMAPTPWSIGVVSALVYAAECAALGYVLWRLVQRSAFSATGVLMALVFASSAFVVMSAHLFGYLDGLLYLLTIAAVGLILRGRPLAAAPIQVAAVLVHESYLLVGLPLAVTASVLVCTGGGNRPAWRGHALTHTLALLTAAALIVYLAFGIDAPAYRQQLTQYLAAYDFVRTRGALVAICHTTSFADFFRRQVGLFAGRCLDPAIALPVLPAFLVLASGAWLSFRGRMPALRLLLPLAATTAPMLMHALAWDTARITCYGLGGVLIAVWMLFELGTPAEADDRAWTILAAQALAANILTEIPLMDAQRDVFTAAVRVVLFLPAIVLAMALAVRPVEALAVPDDTQAVAE